MSENNMIFGKKATYTVEEIAEILNVSIRKAYDLCSENPRFGVLRLGKRCVRVHKESFDKWFNEYNYN